MFGWDKELFSSFFRQKQSENNNDLRQKSKNFPVRFIIKTPANKNGPNNAMFYLRVLASN